MSEKVLNVLFLCTHNSARSILAEAILNHIGHGRFKAWSAGSSPRENQLPNPLGLQILKSSGISIDGLRSKSWDEFGASDAPHMDLVITVCDNAAGEVCPYWPGQPATAHWGYPDPSAGEGSDVQKLEAFRQTLHAIQRRLELFVSGHCEPSTGHCEERSDAAIQDFMDRHGLRPRDDANPIPLAGAGVIA